MDAPGTCADAHRSVYDDPMRTSDQPPPTGPRAPPNERRRLERSRLGPGLGVRFALVSAFVAGLAAIAAWPAVREATWGGWSGAAADARLPPDLRPLELPRVTALPQFAGEYHDGMLWGSYRPGLYFGLRTRQPRGLVVGAAWLVPGDGPGAPPRLRHWAEERDGLGPWGWARHDGRSFGRHEVTDGGYALTAAFAKTPGAGPGGDWGMRLTMRWSGTKDAVDTNPAGDGSEGEPPPDSTLIIYVLDERPSSRPSRGGKRSAGNTWSLELTGMGDGNTHGGEADVDGELAQGMTPGIGRWAIHSSPGDGVPANGHRARRGGVRAAQRRGAMAHNLTALLWASLETRPGTPPELLAWRETGGNLMVWERTGALPLAWDVAFVTAGEGHHGGHLPLVGARLTSTLAAREAAFESKYNDTFPVLPVDGVDLGDVREMAAQGLSNLLGGMGYFAGRGLVAMPTGDDGGEAVVEAPDSVLFTAVPSRPFFPRGFLWDEGFHQLLVVAWDPHLARDCLAHWLDAITASGWLPREQVLGDEARARVPAPYLAQRPRHANPPTLLLPLLHMARGLEEDTCPAGDRAAVAQFLSAAYPRAAAWFDWLASTQAGELPGSYRWRGRIPGGDVELNPKTLTSGLDDYPRASHPSPEERHVDLRSWVQLGAKCLAALARAAGDDAGEVKYNDLHASLDAPGTLRRLHWDAGRRQFADWGRHTEGLVLTSVLVEGGEGGMPRTELRRRPALDQPPPSAFVPHLGYVSLFPLLLRQLAVDSTELGDVLTTLDDPNGLWAPAGLRSLSRSSPLFGARNTAHDPPYWRGAVWLNCNYLALGALRHYGRMPGPHAAAATALGDRLRVAVLGGASREWSRTGYLWESYGGDETGAGRGTRPFTGWSALVALIAADVYAEL